MKLLLDEAKRRKINETDLAKKLGVDKQRLSNWKRRGVPKAFYPLAADFLRCTIDELVGRGLGKSEPVQMLYGYGLTEEGARLAFEWQKLPPNLKEQIQTLIESMVSAMDAAQLRDESETGKNTKGKPLLRHN